MKKKYTSAHAHKQSQPHTSLDIVSPILKQINISPAKNYIETAQLHLFGKYHLDKLRNILLIRNMLIYYIVK
jgi:hypothetical protein